MAINFLKKKDQDDIFEDAMGIEDDRTSIWDESDAMVSIADDELETEEDGNDFEGINDSAVTLKIVTPKSLSEVVKIADYLVGGSSVVLNIEELSESDVVRFMDYLQGVLHVINGNMKQVSKTTCVATPNNVGLDSEISEVEEGSDE